MSSLCMVFSVVLSPRQLVTTIVVRTFKILNLVEVLGKVHGVIFKVVDIRLNHKASILWKVSQDVTG